MGRSPGLRFFIVGLLTLLMVIPVVFVSEAIDDRADHSRRTVESVGRDWGGHQVISGPVLVVPVEARVRVRERQELTDPKTGEQLLDGKGNPRIVVREVEKTETRAPVYLYPERFEVMLDAPTEERYRGIFRVPVYRAQAEMVFDFPTDAVAAQLVDGETALWQRARIRLGVSSNRALRGTARLSAGTRDLPLEPLAGAQQQAQGIEARTGDPRDFGVYTATLALNGAHALSITPAGRESRITLRSDWPHPSFVGAFLPDAQQVTEAGFTAEWTIPHLARAVPQVSREDHETAARQGAAFGVRFYQPNDVYQKSYRAAHYGVMFIGLTFLTIFLLEGAADRPAHAVQYILVGLAQAVFFVLLLALAEQMGFGPAYLVAAGATVALITAFGAVALRLGRRTGLLFVLQVILYGVLYLILRSADYALLAGSVLAFAAIAATMFATRNADWHGHAPGRGGGLLNRWRTEPAASAAAPPAQG
ncbi:cell envelope integrity protein CreD [Marimonas arenosa]|uniref:Cell envelope integrity protein CreD n=1 Tax=Marimonas arenosa TaxID=1795305 RepID=A0AAE4B6G4_9RHOB|nr:cell envelope integrity protein CreD [Marimonas arenosa]MDQ2092107.1 cell envelope integrity protein CreD [Marimonas arenosa]